MATFVLPRRLEQSNLFVAFGDFVKANPELPREVAIDLSELTFASPPSIAFLSNLTYWLSHAGVTVSFSGANIRRHAIKYLDDSQFFAHHTGSQLDPMSECRPTTIPVQRVAKTDSHAWLEFDFIPWLVAKSGLSTASLAEVKTCIQELFNNISDHTEFDQGCIYGQWYPNQKKIVISIADFGVGIPHNVAKIVKGLSDNEAIIRAAEDGFSSKSLPTNRGAGLFLLLLNVVQRFNGRVTIRSASGYVKFENVKNSIYTYPQVNCGYCIGTTIDLVLYTDRIPHAEEEEDFEWS